LRIATPEETLWTDVAKEAVEIEKLLKDGDDLASLRHRIDDLGDLAIGGRKSAQERLFADLRESAPQKSLVLGRRRLLEFLAVRALGANSLLSVLARPNGGHGPAAREKLFLIKTLSSLVASLEQRVQEQLDWSEQRQIVWNDPSDVAVDPEAVVHVLAEIARREFGVPSVIDVEGTLRSFARVEPALHLWREAYRDHLLHAADVCILGWLLLDSVQPRTGESLASFVAGMLETSEKDVYRNWFLAALVHDVGYALDAIRQALKHVAYLKSDYLEQLRNQLDKRMGDVRKRIEQNVLEGLTGPNADGLDHGVVGFLHLGHVLEETITDPRKRAMLRPACLAVQKHSLPFPLAFTSEPIAALLVLCDELQEWERPLVSGRKLAAGTRDLVAGYETTSPPTAKALESLTLVGIEPRPGEEGFQFTGDALECCLTYKPPKLGKFWPQRVGLEKCRNLQRVDPSGLPFGVRITLVNQYLSGTSTREYGLEALRSYALGHPELGLVDFVDGSRDGIEIVRFTQEPGSIESISFDLGRLNRFPLLPERLKVNWDDFAKWTVARPDPYDLEPPPLLRHEM
jgi:hypothetical protein